MHNNNKIFSIQRKTATLVWVHPKVTAPSLFFMSHCPFSSVKVQVSARKSQEMNTSCRMLSRQYSQSAASKNLRSLSCNLSALLKFLHWVTSFSIWQWYTLTQYRLNNVCSYLINSTVKLKKKRFEQHRARGSFLSNCSFSCEGSVVINGWD